MRTRRAEVEIFNFSFLDILACTIGLLIFIMVMIFVLQSGSTPLANHEQVIARNVARAKEYADQMEADERMIGRIDEQLASVNNVVDHKLLVDRDAAKARLDSVTADWKSSRGELDRALTLVAQRTSERDAFVARQTAVTRQLDEAKRANTLAQRTFDAATLRAANAKLIVRPRAMTNLDSDGYVVHVDCRTDRIVVMQILTKGDPVILSTTAVSAIGGENSPYIRSMERVSKAQNPVVVFWVRPGAIDSFEGARRNLPQGLAFGYEPAPQNWSFGDNEERAHE